MVATSLDEIPAGADYAVAVLNNIAPISAPGLTEELVDSIVGISDVVVFVLTLVCGLGGSLAYGLKK